MNTRVKLCLLREDANSIIRYFLDSTTLFIGDGFMDTKELFDQGLNTRKSVLGEEYVNNSIKNADEFQMKLQEFVTTHAWGAIWGREGLPLKTRSMINIAMLAALGRTHEFRLHLGGAINNGVTKDEIAEILIQVGGYAGFPCAVDGFRQAREVFKEKDI